MTANAKNNGGQWALELGPQQAAPFTSARAQASEMALQTQEGRKMLTKRCCFASITSYHHNNCEAKGKWMDGGTPLTGDHS